ncbi:MULTISPECIES: hypothetical protein [unclassified Ruegeria]|nr:MULTISPECIES: hypothetical protein [unclassified Ruegeria]
MLSDSILDTTLIGGQGDDILIAGAGATTMSGGAGSDIFVIQSGSGLTTISDFNQVWIGWTCSTICFYGHLNN